MRPNLLRVLEPTANEVERQNEGEDEGSCEGAAVI